MSTTKLLRIADFGPYTQSGQSPGDVAPNSTPPPLSQMEAEVNFIAFGGFANTLRLYTIADQQGSLINFAIQDGLNVIPSVFLDNPTGADYTVSPILTDFSQILNSAPPSNPNTTIKAELDNFVATLESLPASDLAKLPFVVVGNEEISEVGGWNETDIEDAIAYVKQSLPTSIASQLQFTTAETYAVQYINLHGAFSYNTGNPQSYSTTGLGQNPDINVIFANINPYFDNKESVSDAAAYVDQIYQALQNLYGPGTPYDKQVVISETGWPSSGVSQDNTGQTINSTPYTQYTTANEQLFWQTFLQIANQQNISFGDFETYDEPNKDTSGGPMARENNLGLITTNSGPTNESSTFKTMVTSILPSSAPVITAPSAAAVTLGQATAVTRISLSESVTVVAEFYSVELRDTNGDLSATGAFGTFGGTTTLQLSGSLSDVNALLATLTDTDVTAGPDTITITANDSQGGSAISKQIVVSITSSPPNATPVTLDTMQPGDFADRGVNDTIWMGTDGSVRIYEITKGMVTAAPTVAVVGSDWSFAAVGHFFGTGAASDFMLRRTDGTFELYQVQNDQLVGASQFAVVGSDWSVVAAADFYQTGSDSLLMQRAGDGALELYNVQVGRIVGASQLGVIGSDWVFAGTGNFYNNGTLDFLEEQQGTGALEIWQVRNGQIVAANQIGVVGSDEHVVGVADFNHDGTSDFLMQSNSGTFRIYEVQNGHVMNAPVVATIGTNWQPAGVGNFSGGGMDFLMRSGPSVELYHVQNYQVTAASVLAAVGSDIQIAGAYFNHPV